MKCIINAHTNSAALVICQTKVGLYAYTCPPTHAPKAAGGNSRTPPPQKFPQLI